MAVLGCNIGQYGLLRKRQNELIRTRISDANANVPAVKVLSIELQGLLKTIDSSELGISKALGATLGSVLDDADTDNLTVGKEVGHVFLVGVVREVTEMGGIRGLIGQLGGKLALLAGVA